MGVFDDPCLRGYVGHTGQLGACTSAMAPPRTDNPVGRRVPFSGREITCKPGPHHKYGDCGVLRCSRIDEHVPAKHIVRVQSGFVK